MKETKYMIKEAARKLFVEPHVLRYWEEELDMNIKRNEMGHRYYTEDDIHTLKQVRDLKSKGLQLKAIKTFLHSGKNPEEIKKIILSSKQEMNTSDEESLNRSDAGEVNLEETEIISDNKISDEKVFDEKLSDAKVPGEKVSDEKISEETVSSEAANDKMPMIANQDKMEQFQIVMNRVIGNALKENHQIIGQAAGDQVTETVVKKMHSIGEEHEAKEEERFQRLDTMIREIQQMRLEAAAAEVYSGNRKKRRGRKR